MKTRVAHQDKKKAARDFDLTLTYIRNLVKATVLVCESIYCGPDSH